MTKDYLPSWMNTEFFENGLRKKYPQAKLKSFQISKADEKTYNGGIYRVVIKYFVNNVSTEIISQHLFIKTVSDNEYVLKFHTSMNVYAKEMEFYERIKPKLETILKDIRPKVSLFPEILDICKVNSAIVIEDLSVIGYSIPSLRPGINIETAQAILRKLALFHAGSAALQQQEPDIFANFKHGLINRSGHDTMSFHTAHLNAIIDYLSTCDDFLQYRNKLCDFRPQFEEKARNAFDSKKNQFNTLIHGDLWTANAMIQRSSSDKFDLDDLKLIDYQFCCWTSPAVDLQFFLNSSLEFSIHKTAIYDLVKYYHSHLVKALNELLYRGHIPTIEELVDNFNERSICGVMSSCFFLPEIQVDHPEVDADVYFSDTEEARQFKRAILNAPIAQQIIRFFIPYYDRLGVFN